MSKSIAMSRPEFLFSVINFKPTDSPVLGRAKAIAEAKVSHLEKEVIRFQEKLGIQVSNNNRQNLAKAKKDLKEAKESLDRLRAALNFTLS